MCPRMDFRLVFFFMMNTFDLSNVKNAFIYFNRDLGPRRAP